PSPLDVCPAVGQERGRLQPAESGEPHPVVRHVPQLVGQLVPAGAPVAEPLRENPGDLSDLAREAEAELEQLGALGRARVPSVANPGRPGRVFIECNGSLSRREDGGAGGAVSYSRTYAAGRVELINRSSSPSPDDSASTLARGTPAGARTGPAGLTAPFASH